jgi:hypothetical protein
MGEYAAMFVFSGIFSAVFLGGYNVLPVNWTAIGAPQIQTFNEMFAGIWFLGKTAFLFSCFIWLRATLPRLRYDQLMSLGWRSLLPTAVANFLLVGFWILATDLWGVEIGWICIIAGYALMFAFIQLVKFFSKERMEDVEHREILLTSGKEAYMGAD